MKSKIIWLISKNLSLGHHARYDQEHMDRNPIPGLGMNGHVDPKKVDRIAGQIVAGLSQYSVGDLLAKEWDLLPSFLRLAIATIANAPGNSGNVRKGVAYANALLNGRLLRTENVRTERVIRTSTDGTIYRDTRRVNVAIASAQAAHAIVARPANYDQLPPAEKRRINNELAQARRNFRK